MSELKTNTETQVETISVDEMDNLLGTPGAESVMTPDETAGEVKPKSFFQKEKVDMEFLDPDSPTNPPEPIDPPEEPAAVAAEAPAGDPTITDSFDSLIEDNLGEEAKDKGGRPSLDKEGMSQLVNALIKDNVLLPFEDDKKEEDYTLDDYKELIQMNIANQKQEAEANTPREFFDSLPQELQYAAKYVADGGEDLKGMFRALAASEETKAMTIDTEGGQERAARQFLQATNFGNDEEIQEQIDSWKDLDKLEAKAQQFKPKLDAMQDKIVQRQLVEQEGKRAQREKQSQNYADSVYNTLAEGNLSGLKMSNKVQDMLYQGLIQPNYQSVSGQPTNLFGHLIEKHQYVEPDHGLIAEALWLLADPDSYRAEIAKGASNEAVADTARKLKIEQSNKVASGSAETDQGSGKKRSSGGLKREPKNFFKR
jgi:hypothetical protein